MEQSATNSPVSENESDQNLGWAENLLAQVNKIRLKERIDNSNRIDAYGRELKQLRKVTRGELLNESLEADDDVGDTTQTNIDSPQFHYHNPQPAPNRSDGGKLAKYLIGAGLLATGAGAGIGLPILADAISSKPPTEAPSQEAAEPKTQTSTKIIDWQVGEPIVE